MTSRNVALSELFRVGSSKRVLKSQWKNEGVPFYRGREITRLATDGFVNNELFISESDYAEYASKNGVPNPGDIVITAIGTIGNAYIVQEKDRFYFKDASVLWLAKRTDVSSEFINLWLKSPQFFEQLDEGNGATVDTLTIKKLNSVRVDLPPLPEQEPIVAILHEAFAAIATATANAEKSLANARDLFDGYLTLRLNHTAAAKPIQALDDITELIIDCEHKTAPTQETGYPSIRTPNVGRGYLILEKVKRVSEDVYRDWTRRAKPEPGDLILAREAPAGNVAVIPDGEKVCLGQRTVLIRPDKSSVDAHFLTFLLLHPVMQDRLLAHSVGATVEHVNLRDIRALRLGDFPSMCQQRELVRELIGFQQQSGHLVDPKLRKLPLLAELKQSILHKAFTGELTAGTKTADRALSEARI